MAQALKFQPRDLCLVYGENDPRVSSLRVADALHPTDRNKHTRITDFEERNRRELERYGPIPHHKGMVQRPQGGGRKADISLYNEDQVTIICMRSDSKEAEDARFEIVQLIRAYRRGQIPKSEITIIADMFAPERPTIERGEGNVVHVRHEHLVSDDGEVDECERREQARAGKDAEQSRQHDLFQVENDYTLDELVEDAQDTQARHIWADKTAMFMRDELPLGHSADSWRVWVSEQWFRLPLELRQHWWRDTDYGKRAPSQEMIEAIIAIALP
jgi:hypothetical protein